MENETSELIASFIEISGGQTEKTAFQFLEATSWNLEDAVNLFLICRRNPRRHHHQTQEKTVCPEDVWDDSTPEEPSDSRLSSLYRPPLDLLFNGSFEKAKATASIEDLWLLVNLQSTIEFASQSHTLNRDLWSNDAVSQAIVSGFLLWQVYDDTNEGHKISTFYNIDSAAPVILLIDPITGQKMRKWSGMIEAHGFLEDLMKYKDVGPHEHVASLTSNKRIKTEKICFLSSQVDDDHQDMSTFWDNDRVVTPPSWGKEFEETCLSSDDVFEFPVLTEEPKGDCDRSLLCSLCIRFPDGRRKQRKFLKSEPVQLLWSFCYFNMEDSEKRAFKLVQAIPGATKTLDYGAKATFDQSGIDNSIVSVTWE